MHNLILLPSLEAAEELSVRLEAIGNIHSDGRPILGLDSRDLLEIDPGDLPRGRIHPRPYLDAPLLPCSVPSPALTPSRSALGT